MAIYKKTFWKLGSTTEQQLPAIVFILLASQKAHSFLRIYAFLRILRILRILFYAFFFTHFICTTYFNPTFRGRLLESGAEA
jgi:hypothetical protein